MTPPISGCEICFSARATKSAVELATYVSSGGRRLGLTEFDRLADAGSRKPTILSFGRRMWAGDGRARNGEPLARVLVKGGWPPAPARRHHADRGAAKAPLGHGVVGSWRGLGRAFGKADLGLRGLGDHIKRFLVTAADD